MKHADTKPTKKWADSFKHRTGLGVNKIENKHVHEYTKKCITLFTKPTKKNGRVVLNTELGWE